jgi:thymidine phosphorylase
VEGEPIFTLHANDPEKLEQAKRRLANAIVYSERATAPLPTFYDIITGNDPAQLQGRSV